MDATKEDFYKKYNWSKETIARHEQETERLKNQKQITTNMVDIKTDKELEKIAEDYSEGWGDNDDKASFMAGWRAKEQQDKDAIKMINELVKLKLYHISPYNLGDMGRIGEIINTLEKLFKA